MQLALGLVALITGVDFAVSGFTNRSFSRLLFGYWDAPNTARTPGQPPDIGGGNALTGGVHAPSNIRMHGHY